MMMIIVIMIMIMIMIMVMITRMKLYTLMKRIFHLSHTVYHKREGGRSSCPCVKLPLVSCCLSLLRLSSLVLLFSINK